MYTNVINNAFEGITRIPDAVALLEIFYTLARRDMIKQTCLKRTTYIYMLFVRWKPRTTPDCIRGFSRPTNSIAAFGIQIPFARALDALVTLCGRVARLSVVSSDQVRESIKSSGHSQTFRFSHWKLPDRVDQIS